MLLLLFDNDNDFVSARSSPRSFFSAQAAAVALLLRTAAERWAAAAGGELWMDPAAAAAAAADSEWGEAPWAGEALIKGVRRAAAKASLCYGEDMSRVV